MHYAIDTQINKEVLTRREELFGNDSILFFPVWKRPAFYPGKGITTQDGSFHPNYFEDTQHDHIVRMINNKPVSLGIVGNKYKLVPMKDICDEIEDLFVREFNEEQLSGVYIKDDISYNGAKLIRHYIFPSISARINDERSKIAFRVIIINGYDGSSSLKLYNGAIDFFCTNGMVSGAHDVTIRKHTSGLELSGIVLNVQLAIEKFYKSTERWEKWGNILVSNKEAQEYFERFPNTTKSLTNKLFTKWLVEAEERGQNLWALYSAATYYATHNEHEFTLNTKSKANEGALLLKREEQVMKWVNSNPEIFI